MLSTPKDRGADRDLIRSFLAGNATAVFRIARWVSLEVRVTAASRHGADKEDLIQEGMLRVFRALAEGGYRGESGLERYVRSVARHGILDHLRRRQLPTVTEEGLPATLMDAAPSVDGALAAGQLAGRLIAKLPAEEGRLLIEAYALERPYAEMAAARGIALSALKVRVFRAVRRARQALTELAVRPRGGAS